MTTNSPTFGQSSRKGQRPNQEDRHEVSKFETAGGTTALLALVADGVGGARKGERASRLATETIRDYLEQARPALSEIPQALKAAFEEAQRRIRQEQIANPDYAGMSTTCTAAVIAGNRLYLGHVGDSRAYLVRDGKLHRLTRDHSAPDGKLTRCLGGCQESSVDTRYRLIDKDEYGDTSSGPLSLNEGDSLLLCSDGVYHNGLSSEEILSIVRQVPASEAAPTLVERALRAGSKDNVTAVVIDLPAARKSAAFPRRRRAPTAQATVAVPRPSRHEEPLTSTGTQPARGLLIWGLVFLVLLGIGGGTVWYIRWGPGQEFVFLGGVVGGSSQPEATETISRLQALATDRTHTPPLPTSTLLVPSATLLPSPTHTWTPTSTNIPAITEPASTTPTVTLTPP